jgi:hypothetical protein
LNEFRNYINVKKQEIEDEKALIQRLAEEDEQLELAFIDEIEKELDKK